MTEEEEERRENENGLLGEFSLSSLFFCHMDFCPGDVHIIIHVKVGVPMVPSIVKFD